MDECEPAQSSEVFKCRKAKKEKASILISATHYKAHTHNPPTRKPVDSQRNSEDLCQGAWVSWSIHFGKLVSEWLEYLIINDLDNAQQ